MYSTLSFYASDWLVWDRQTGRKYWQYDSHFHRLQIPRICTNEFEHTHTHTHTHRVKIGCIVCTCLQEKWWHHWSHVWRDVLRPPNSTYNTAVVTNMQRNDQAGCSFTHKSNHKDSAKKRVVQVHNVHFSVFSIALIWITFEIKILWIRIFVFTPSRLYIRVRCCYSIGPY